MKQELTEKVLSVIQERSLINADSAVLLMVSGGSDSTAMAYLMASLRDAGYLGAVDMLHVNHKLRGAAADKDAEFVAGLAQLLDIPLFSCEIDIAAEAARLNENVEAIARRERYIAADESLDSMCRHENIPLSEGRIVTAHTADDRMENFYMRSIVGTGPGGFRSMMYRNGPIVRPFLESTREDLRIYIKELAESGQPVMRDAAGNLWREDATNAHTDRFRAYVRVNMVPAAKAWNYKVAGTLTRTMNLIADEDDMLEKMVDSIIQDQVEVIEGVGSFLLLPTFGSVERPLQRRALVRLMKQLLGASERIDTASVEAIADAFEDGKPKSGFVTNIQGNLAVSANKCGVLVEPMAEFRRRRKKD